MFVVLFCRIFFSFSLRFLCDMAVKNSSVGALLKPSLLSDGSGCFMYVSCGNNSAQLYLDKLDESRRPLGKCILFKGSWFSPSDLSLIVAKRQRNGDRPSRI